MLSTLIGIGLYNCMSTVVLQYLLQLHFYKKSRVFQLMPYSPYKIQVKQHHCVLMKMATSASGRRIQPKLYRFTETMQTLHMLKSYRTLLTERVSYYRRTTAVTM